VLLSGYKNLTITNVLNKIFDDFRAGGYTDIIRQFVGDMTSITAKNAEYFRIVQESNDKIFDAKKEANERLRRQLGITEKGQVQQSGYLDRLIKE
jgi:hypothetical protein